MEVSLSTDRLIASLRAQEPEAGSSTTGAGSTLVGELTRRCTHNVVAEPTLRHRRRS
jgi:hypothetical protein